METKSKTEKLAMFFVSGKGPVVTHLFCSLKCFEESTFSGKMVSGLINANPVVYEKKERRVRSVPSAAADEYAVEPIDQQEIFDILSLFIGLTYDLGLKVVLYFDLDIKDPEHPYSLEELKVISEDAIDVDDSRGSVRVTFTPTVEHCSMATVIGLCLRVKLLRSLPSRYKVDIRVAPGSHATEAAVNKQLNDKERVAAALENPGLLDMVDECLSPSYE
ncbi:PREDICTED: AE7 [Prunus dulcis]|uniref:PREDICTED: AE7 n=1 Tax=Prunus dulcis TaxID=3755 RepID=A0A5E4ERP7_PRUDU|nr:PREDICTED: AE7 [Prunus dulcis]